MKLPFLNHSPRIDQIHRIIQTKTRFFSDFLFRLKSAIQGNSVLNGCQLSVTFGEVYRKYLELHAPTLSRLTALKQKERCERHLKPLFEVRMSQMTPERVSIFLEDAKARVGKRTHPSRKGFQKELKDVHRICAWWMDQFDFKFQNPVRSFHWPMAVIEESFGKDRRISPQEVQRFLACLPPFYRDMAKVQFYTGGRVGEVAGIQLRNVNIERRVLTIREVITWVKGSPTVSRRPKTKHIREVYLNDTLLEIFTRRLSSVYTGCPFVFHDQGKALRYNRINNAYNKAWRDAGLEEFSGTHLMRYAAAQTIRRLTGSLEAVAAVTGHRSQAMAEKYSFTDVTELNRTSVVQVEKLMMSLKAVTQER